MRYSRIGDPPLYGSAQVIDISLGPGLAVKIVTGPGTNTGIDSVAEDDIASPDCVNVSVILAVVGFGVVFPPLVPPVNDPKMENVRCCPGVSVTDVVVIFVDWNVPRATFVNERLVPTFVSNDQEPIGEDVGKPTK